MKLRMKKWTWIVVAALVMSPLAGVALAAPMEDVKEKSDNPALEGIETTKDMATKAMEDVAEGTVQAAEATVDATVKTAEAMGVGMEKAAKKTVEAGQRAFEAMTQDKVQAGVAGGLVLGVPAGGAAYLIAAAAGASNPLTAGLITMAAVTSVVAAQTARQYEKEHQNQPGS